MFFFPFPYVSDLSLYFREIAHLRGAIFLDSVPYALKKYPYDPDDWPKGTGRYSYIMALPTEIYSFSDKDPFPFLKQFIKNKRSAVPSLPPFQGGLCGFFSYDLYRFIEKIDQTVDDVGFPDLCVGLYENVLAFDHCLKKGWLMAHNKGHPSFDCLFSLGEKAPQSFHHLSPYKKGISSPPTPFNILSDHSKETYLPLVEKVIDYIKAGDVYQLNLTKRFQSHLPKNQDLYPIYEHLRKLNGAPFSCFLNLEPTYILSSSPEHFLKCQDGMIETRPIKGTRKRILTSDTEDLKMINHLKNAEKDKSENLMIVDLLRNDLSKVSLPGSVHVKDLFSLETYQTVHHLVSVIEGKIDPAYDAIDLLKAAFPGGSITGAPKIRAMEIIRDLEKTARGPYCGSVGYISFSGDMDTSILIRTLCAQRKENHTHLTFQVGGGVVFDSSPLEEFEETEAKAFAIKQTLNAVQNTPLSKVR